MIGARGRRKVSNDKVKKRTANSAKEKSLFFQDEGKTEKVKAKAKQTLPVTMLGSMTKFVNTSYGVISK